MHPSKAPTKLFPRKESLAVPFFAAILFLSFLTFYTFSGKNHHFGISIISAGATLFYILKLSRLFLGKEYIVLRDQKIEHKGLTKYIEIEWSKISKIEKVPDPFFGFVSVKSIIISYFIDGELHKHPISDDYFNSKDELLKTLQNHLKP